MHILLLFVNLHPPQSGSYFSEVEVGYTTVLIENNAQRFDVRENLNGGYEVILLKQLLLVGKLKEIGGLAYLECLMGYLKLRPRSNLA